MKPVSFEKLEKEFAVSVCMFHHSFWHIIYHITEICSKQSEDNPKKDKIDLYKSKDKDLQEECRKEYNKR